MARLLHQILYPDAVSKTGLPFMAITYRSQEISQTSGMNAEPSETELGAGKLRCPCPLWKTMSDTYPRPAFHTSTRATR